MTVEEDHGLLVVATSTAIFLAGLAACLAELPALAIFSLSTKLLAFTSEALVLRCPQEGFGHTACPWGKAK